MISTMTRAEEKVIQDLAYIAGGEAALERAILDFRRREGRSPSGKELLDTVARQRLTDLQGGLEPGRSL
jgi:hypothetical protein